MISVRFPASYLPIQHLTEANSHFPVLEVFRLVYDKMKRPLKDTQSTSTVTKYPKIEDDSVDAKPDGTFRLYLTATIGLHSESCAL